MLYLFADELSAGAGGIILLLLLLTITAAVFAVKFALDIAVSRKFTPKSFDEEPPKHFYREPRERNVNDFFYAVKNEGTQRKKTSSPRKSNPAYTIIPKDKLFILENPDRDKRYYN